jgi:hypothetical protein
VTHKTGKISSFSQFFDKLGLGFIVGMNLMGMAATMRIFIGFAAVNIILSLFLKESKMISQG